MDNMQHSTCHRQRPGAACLAIIAGCWLLLLCGLPAFAQQTKLESLKVGARTYKKVTVLGYNATDVYFTHSKGISNAKLRLLEPEMQKRFQYNEEASKRAEQQQEIDNEEFNKQVVATIEEGARAAAELKRRKDFT